MWGVGWRSIIKMFTCPFCSADIDESLVRFGGNCPHCFNVIPGEEAPTDPGISVQEAPASAPSSENNSNKALYVFGFLALVAIGVVFGGMGKEEGETPVLGSEQENSLLADQDGATEAEGGEKGDAADSLESTEGNDGALAEVEPAVSEKEPPVAKPVEKPAPKKTTDSSRKEVQPESKRPTKEVEAPRKDDDDVFVMPPLDEGFVMVLETPSEINAAVRRTTRKKKGQLEQCYNQQLKADPALKGRWIVGFTIKKDGSTSGVSVKHMDQRSRDFEDCVKRSVQKWKFPAIAYELELEKEYSFRP